jgi:hypothetical protein
MGSCQLVANGTNAVTGKGLCPTSLDPIFAIHLIKPCNQGLPDLLIVVRIGRGCSRTARGRLQLVLGVVQCKVVKVLHVVDHRVNGGGFKGLELSSRLLEDYQDEFILEHYQLIKYAKDDLNNWYAEKVIGGKVRDFLNQLVITLGPRNWIVTWIGHGPVSRAKILNNFINEGEFHHKFIIDMYDKWYEEAVIYASDKMMRTPTPNFRLTNFVPEN